MAVCEQKADNILAASLQSSGTDHSGAAEEPIGSSRREMHTEYGGVFSDCRHANEGGGSRFLKCLTDGKEAQSRAAIIRYVQAGQVPFKLNV